MNSVYKKARSLLKKFGILIMADPELPSFTTTIAGEPIKGSWWGHSKGNLIHNLSGDMMNEPDVLTVKLINKKITFLNRGLWNSFYSIASKESAWQTKNLTSEQKSLLSKVKRAKTLRTDDKTFKKSPGEIGKLASKLEEQLLIYSESIHSDSGKHIRVLSTWDEALRIRNYQPQLLPIEKAQQQFEDARFEISRYAKARVKFPWDN